jgi:hypothetical protein
MTVLNNPERQSVLVVLCCDPISNSRIVPAWSFDCVQCRLRYTSFEASRETIPHNYFWETIRVDVYGIVVRISLEQEGG